MAHFNVEVAYDSRSFSLSMTSIKQKIVVIACLDPEIEPVISISDLFGQDDDIVALEYAYSIFPNSREFPDYFGEIRLCVLENIEISNVGPNQWKFEGEYTWDINRGTGGQATANSEALPYIKIGFSIGGGTQHVMKSHKEISRVAASGTPGAIFPTPPDEIGIIGLGADSIEGTEVPDSSFRIQITAYFLPSFLTMTFANTVATLIAGKYNMGSYNNATYMGRPAGEVQLLSATGGGTVVDIIPVTFDFSIKNNITAETDAGFPTLTMLGHNLLDYQFHRVFDTNAQKLLLKPVQRIVHETATPADYSTLRIPGL